MNDAFYKKCIQIPKDKNKYYETITAVKNGKELLSYKSFLIEEENKNKRVWIIILITVLVLLLFIDESAKKYVNIKNGDNLYKDTSILLIEFCEKCISYTIFKIGETFSFATCDKCKESICLECLRKNDNNSYEQYYSLCFKGYLKGIFVRTIRKSELIRALICFNIMDILFCLFMAPLYIGFISYCMGFMMHQNKKGKIKSDIFYNITR